MKTYNYHTGLKFLAVTWIIIGLALLITGIDHYIVSMQSALWSFPPDPEEMMKIILAGIGVLIIGIGLLVKPKMIQVELYSILIWLLFFDVCTKVKYIVLSNSGYIIDLDFVFEKVLVSCQLLILIYPTVWYLRRTALHDMNSSIKTVFKKNTIWIIAETILFSVIGFTLVELFPFPM